jgi:small subunit ribosomal protein S3
LRANIDYGFFEAKTTAGRIGVKCWINKGEVMPEGFRSDQVPGDEESAAQSGGRPGGGRPGGGRPPGGDRGGQRGGGPR